MIDLSISIAACGLALSLATFFIGRNTAAKNTGLKTGQVLADLSYIKDGIEDLKHKMENFEKQQGKLNERVTRLEEAMRIYHHTDGFEA